MFAITGVTGKVGGALARALLAKGEAVRAVIRDPAKGNIWSALGCEVAVAAMEDGDALTAAFAGTTAAFILLPPVFDPTPGYPESRRVIDSVVAAIKAAKPDRVLCLSTIGGDAARDNLLSQLTLLEQAVMTLNLPVTILRPSWFIENALWDVATAREDGVIHSFLQASDKPIPMVATGDVGRVAAELIGETWTGTRIVELEGPRRLSPDDLAAAFGRALGKPVRVETVAREGWDTLFRSQGMKHPGPRIAMLDGFNEGWIAFQDDGAKALKGRIDADSVIASLVVRPHG